MNRQDLDALAARHRLSRSAVEVALDLANARPSAAELTRFAVRLLELAGVLSLAAGAVFFIAANWDAMHVFARFVLVEALLVVSVGVALSKPPPHALGRYALLLAFVMTGVLLALFGQTYQTGADVYELFLTWAALGLVFAVAAEWSVTSAAWVLVLDIALALYCGFRPTGGVLALVFSDWRLHPSVVLLAPAVLNVLLWLAAENRRDTRWSAAAPRWLGGLVLACGVGFATWAGALAIVAVDRPGGVLALLVVLALFAAVGAYALKRRADVFPLALIAGSLIVQGTVALGRHAGFDDAALFFVLAAWLVASSTAAGRWLMGLLRAWRDEAMAA